MLAHGIPFMRATGNWRKQLAQAMVIDCHVHVNAFTPAHGFTSQKLANSIGFRFMRWAFGIAGHDESTEIGVRQKLSQTIDATPELDAAVVLAFDGVHDLDGNFDSA